MVQLRSIPLSKSSNIGYLWEDPPKPMFSVGEKVALKYSVVMKIAYFLRGETNMPMSYFEHMYAHPFGIVEDVFETADPRSSEFYTYVVSVGGAFRTFDVGESELEKLEDYNKRDVQSSLKLSSWEDLPNYTDKELEYLQGFFTEKKENGILYRYNRKGQLHNTRGPAIIWDNGTVAYWVNGKLHRTDGPAVIRANGTVEYWVDGKQLSEEEFNRRYGRNRVGSLQVKAEDPIFTDKLSSFAPAIISYYKAYAVSVHGNTFELPGTFEQQEEMVNQATYYLSDLEWMKRYCQDIVSRPFDAMFSEDDFDTNGNHDEIGHELVYVLRFYDGSMFSVSFDPLSSFMENSSDAEPYSGPYVAVEFGRVWNMGGGNSYGVDIDIDALIEMSGAPMIDNP